MDQIIARKTWRTLEPIHGLIYFAPEAHHAYGELGLEPKSGYFASRSAAMGRATAETVVATFFNFNPAVVTSAMTGVWDTAGPEAVLEARHAAADQALQRAIGDAIHSADIARAAGLARQAAEVATQHLEGRPLFAAHASLGWPSSPHLVLWHAQMLLREFRGDGHIAVLVGAGISGLESLILHAATGTVPAAILQKTRGWSDDAWADAIAGLTERGVVNEDGSFTDSGAEVRADIEDRTDSLALTPYRALGEDNCRLLRELARPFAKTISETSFPVAL